MSAMILPFPNKSNGLQVAGLDWEINSALAPACQCGCQEIRDFYDEFVAHAHAEGAMPWRSREQILADLMPLRTTGIEDEIPRRVLIAELRAVREPSGGAA